MTRITARLLTIAACSAIASTWLPVPGNGGIMAMGAALVPKPPAAQLLRQSAAVMVSLGGFSFRAAESNYMVARLQGRRLPVGIALYHADVAGRYDWARPGRGAERGRWADALHGALGHGMHHGSLESRTVGGRTAAIIHGHWTCSAIGGGASDPYLPLAWTARRYTLARSTRGGKPVWKLRVTEGGRDLALVRPTGLALAAWTYIIDPSTLRWVSISTVTVVTGRFSQQVVRMWATATNYGAGPPIRLPSPCR